MAKMWPVTGLRPNADFAYNARRVIEARIAELYSNVPYLAERANDVGLHALRISIKRLRYSLEFFAVCFDETELTWMLTSLAEFQELLGLLHDADEVVPHLHTVLGELTELSSLASEGTELSSLSAEQSPGVLYAIRRMREQRNASYEQAVRLWQEMEAQGFRSRLEALVGRSGRKGKSV